MIPTLHTGASLLLKIHYPDSGLEHVIGFARNLSYSVNQGQKLIYVVDSPFPVEVAQGASPSAVRGSLTTYLPKGLTPEAAGLVPYRYQDEVNLAAASRYIHIRVYDRLANTLVFSCDYCKIGSYTVNIPARGIVEVSFSFEGMFLTPGQSL